MPPLPLRSSGQGPPQPPGSTFRAMRSWHGSCLWKVLHRNALGLTHLTTLPIVVQVQQLLEALLIDERFADGRHRCDCECPVCESELIKFGRIPISVCAEGKQRVNALCANDENSV